jgi:HSP20 family protein
MTRHHDNRESERHGDQERQGDRQMARQGQGAERGLARSYQDPFEALESMFTRLQREFFGMPLLSPWRLGRTESDESTRVPQMRVRDAGDALELTVELPGINPEDVKVEIEGDTLTVRGENAREEQSAGGRVQRRVSFYRQLQLPEDFDTDNVQASYRHGMLVLRLPRRSEGRRNVRQVPISTESGQQPAQQGSQQKSPDKSQAA